MKLPFDSPGAIVILIYFTVVLGIGLFRNKRRFSEDESDYLLAGRKLTIFPFTASLVATWYGGILGVGEFTFTYGISNWVVFGLPYYIFALLFAFFVAGKIRQSESFTIPDRFHQAYGRGPAIISAVLVMILASPAPYILSVGVLLGFLFDLPLLPALILATLLSMIYIYRGGFRSVVRTDVLQFMLMFTGFGALVLFAFSKYGGFGELTGKLNIMGKSLHLTWHGGNSTQYIVVWFFIALWTFVDPGFYQRCAAAKSPAIARRGILISILFWVAFDFLTLTAGLYSVLLPTGVVTDAKLALPLLGMEILPPLLQGLFFAGLLATIMSTVDSLGFISAITFGRDIMARRKENSIKWTQIGLVVVGIGSLIMAWAIPSVVDLWLTLGSVVVPGLLLPFLGTFLPQVKIPKVEWMMIASAGASIIWFLLGAADVPFLGVQPFYAGLVVSVIWTGPGLLKNRGS
ncbi:MAG: sodium:solute symporter [Fidelibacterota bacterium]